MMTDLIYKVYRLEKRLKQLEKNNAPAIREDYGVISKEQELTVNNTVYSQCGKQAILILAPAELLLQASVMNNIYSAKGVLCVPLVRGENKIQLTCCALDQDVKCVLLTKIIDLG